MRVIRHAIDRDQFLVSPSDNSTDVFLYLLFALGADYACARRNCEDDMDIDLRVGVRHSGGIACRS